MKKSILRSLLGRYKKYNGEVFLSRYEHSKFRISEREMRKSLRFLRRNGLNTVGKRYCGEVRFSNLYNISDELLAYIKERVKKIRHSFDIVLFNNETKPDQVKNMLGLSGYGKNLIIEKEEDYVYKYNTEYNIITRWDKTGEDKHEWYNLFNGLKKLFGLDTLQLIKEINGKSI